MIIAAAETFTDGLLGFLCVIWLLESGILFIVGIGDDRESLVWLSVLMFLLYLVARVGVNRHWF